MNLLKGAPNIAHGGQPGSILGIRPEHLDISASGWTVEAEAIETLGAERLVYARLRHQGGSEQLIVRIGEQNPVPAVGSKFHVTARADRLHWFDAATGKRM